MDELGFNFLDAQSCVLASGLRAPSKLVAIALLSHWSRKGRVFPSVTRLALLTSLGRRTVIRELASLVESGAIVATRAKGKSNEYDLTPLATLPAVVPERHRCQSGTSAPAAPDQCQAGTSLVPERHPNRSNKRSRKGSSVGSNKRTWKFVPDDWAPNDSHRDLASKLGVDLDAQERKFRDHEFAKPKSDADRAFNTWLRNAAEWAKANPRGRLGAPQMGLSERYVEGKFEG